MRNYGDTNQISKEVKKASKVSKEEVKSLVLISAERPKNNEEPELQ